MSTYELDDEAFDAAAEAVAQHAESTPEGPEEPCGGHYATGLLEGAAQFERVLREWADTRE